jgi:hypothetical protein
MPETIDKSGPAFPVSIPGWGDNGASGMTLRDYFAGQALVSLTRHILYDQHIEDVFMKAGNDAAALPEFLGEVIYQVADAAILARKKGGVS